MVPRRRRPGKWNIVVVVEDGGVCTRTNERIDRTDGWWNDDSVSHRTTYAHECMGDKWGVNADALFANEWGDAIATRCSHQVNARVNVRLLNALRVT